MVSVMDKLPNEVLLMIFERVPPRVLLSTVARVCRRWAALVRRRALPIARPFDLRRLQPRIVNVEVTLRLDSLRSFLQTLTETCPDLRYLTVNAANPFTLENVRALSGFPRLTHLDVFFQSRILDTKLLPFLLVLGLTSLVINDTVSELVLRELCKNRRFRAIHMHGRALHYPAPELRALIRVRRFRLRELTLRCTELTDSAYGTIGDCRFLMSLQLYSCWCMTIKGALAVTRPKYLRRLHITGARMVRTNALTQFIYSLPTMIEELVLSATCFTDTHVSSLVTCLPELKVLELWRCQLLVWSIHKIAENLTRLENLDIDHPLSESDISKLVKHPSLLHLRCSLGEKRESKYILKPNGQLLRLRAADARYEKRFIRPGGEGYRSSLFYFWTRDREIEPLPRDAHPAFDVDDEEY